MKSFLLVGLLSLGACAAGDSAPFSPVGAFRYGALGHDPFWMVAIGDDRIVLTLGPQEQLASYDYPRALPSESGGVRRWESGEGTQVIAIEARPGPCTAGPRSYADHVRVTLSGRMFEGCGGREVLG